MIDMCNMLWKLELPSDLKSRSTTSPLYQYNTLYALRNTHMTQNRFNDLELEVLAHNFTKFRDHIGPKGVTIHCQVSNGGKSNKNHNYHYTPMLPHINPLLCGLFAKGALLLHRFGCMGEELPYWQNIESFFKKRMLRQSYDDTLPATYNSLSACFTRLYDAVGAHCAKLTHQGRRQGQQELADAGVDIEEIKRWSKYVYDEQSFSYILHVSIDSALQRAGYDYKCPESVYAAHTAVDVSHLVGVLLPRLVQYEKEVAVGFQRCKTFDELKRERLFVARGCYRSMRFNIETFIQCSAARPRDASGAIMLDQKPLYEQWAPTNPLFAQPFFSSFEFKAVVAEVAAKENQEVEVNNTPIPHSTSTLDVSTLAKHLVSPLARKLCETASGPFTPFTCVNCGHVQYPTSNTFNTHERAPHPHDGVPPRGGTPPCTARVLSFSPTDPLQSATSPTAPIPPTATSNDRDCTPVQARSPQAAGDSDLDPVCATYLGGREEVCMRGIHWRGMRGIGGIDRRGTGGTRGTNWRGMGGIGGIDRRGMSGTGGPRGTNWRGMGGTGGTVK